MRLSSLLRALLLAALVALSASAPALARKHDPEKMPTGAIRDLHFGDVLYLYLQNTEDTDFEALTRLLAYQQWNLMPHHQDEVPLLAGSLYLELGMHNEAGEIFARVLTNQVPTGPRNRAWFYLAQIWYARGYYDKADAALRRINGRMSPDLEAQREILFGNVLMHEGRFDEAIAALTNWRGPEVWSAYARFNLGVALIRTKRLNDADPFLSAVGTMLTTAPELEALRDRANLALGFAYLQAEQPARARTALSRVRLNGPYSNKALLGIGWADAALGDYQGALTPWMELRGRNLLDSAVQESYLAVPYAFSKLNANAQSAEYYESAVQSFDAENARLDTAIAAIEKGDMLEHVLAKDRNEEAQFGWAWQLKNLPDAPESRYLYTLLAGNDFQEGLKNYRGLVTMSGKLEQHADDMSAFQDMIETRERAYAERLPRADALLASGAVEKLQARDVALENELKGIEARHDVAALGTDEEREQWARIQRIEAGLAGAPDTPDNAEMRERLALVKGVLFFRLNDAYGARAWQEHRGLKDLSLALHEAQSRWIRVERARKAVPQNTGEFASRVTALRQRIDTLEARLVAAEQQQRNYLAQVAIRELEDQKDRLAAYQIQARFALGSMYDRAASSADEAKPRKGAAPVQKGAEDEPSDEPAPEKPQ
ncbi:MAG: hypothetical protein JSS29_07255 [Proteobacteria bacterium]|nr:hypothetical protein [Pseudomonadota bacterium]